MTSKAEKLRQLRIRQRASAGRPRKAGERNPCGRLKSVETEKEAMSVAVAGRKRVHNLPYDKAGLSGYTLGRIFLDGNISEHELTAGNWYTEQVMRYYGLVGIQFPTARAQNIFAVGGEPGETSAERARQAHAAKVYAMRLYRILSVCENGPQVRSTLYGVCIEDNEMLRMMPAHQMELLRRGLRLMLFESGLQNERKSVT